MSMRASPAPLKRLLTALFPALLGPSQLLLFGPQTIYSINQVEFLVPYSSLAAQWVWPLMAVGGGRFNGGMPIFDPGVKVGGRGLPRVRFVPFAGN